MTTDPRAELDRARDAFLGALERVPLEAGAYLKPGDDHSLGGIVIHVNGALIRYSRVLDAITSGAGASPVDATGIDAGMKAANERSREGIDSEAMGREIAAVTDLHARVAGTLAGLNDEQMSAKTPVVFSGRDEPYMVSPSDIAGWLTEHYDEHVPHVGELLSAWRAQASAN